MAMNDETILAALLSAGSVRAAAKIAGVAEATVRNRMADPVFRGRFDQLRGDLLQAATAGLMARLERATATMTEIMDDDTNPGSVRLAAADALFRHCLRYVTAADFERRIAALEATQNECD